ncbi:MAG: glycosyltransferase, partial [Anaerolineae bacterium]|nr:glycosyltransferase [Anaerolineae bacterium]
MLKIALYHNLPSGGAKRAVYEWTRRLADSHVIDVYTLSTADHTFCDIRPFARKHHILDFIPHRLFASPWGRLNQLQRWRDLGELTRIGRYIADEINEGGYDVVFTHPCLYTFVPTMLRFVEIPTVYYLHEPFGPTFIRRFNRPYLDDSAKWRIVSKRFDPLLALYNHRLEHNRTASIRATTKLLANSQFTQQSVKREYRVDAAVCRCGVNSEDFHPLPDTQKEDFVLSVGELTPRKGFDFLIESIGHIPLDKRPSLKLICNFESPPERRFVEELATQWNVRLQIELNMNTEQLALEYNRALLCVYAPVLEALGLVPLES